MTNKIRAALLSATLFTAPTALANNEFPRFATVDMQTLVKQYHRTSAAQEDLNVQQARIQQKSAERADTLAKLEDDIRKLRKQLDDPALSDKGRQEMFKQFQLKSQEGVSLDREHREFLQRSQTALNEKLILKMREIREEVRKTVADHAKLQNISYLFDRSGRSTSQLPILIYTKDVSDLTQNILKNLNKDAPPVSKTAAAP